MSTPQEHGLLAPPAAMCPDFGLSEARSTRSTPLDGARSQIIGSRSAVHGQLGRGRGHHGGGGCAQWRRWRAGRLGADAGVHLVAVCRTHQRRHLWPARWACPDEAAQVRDVTSSCYVQRHHRVAGRLEHTHRRCGTPLDRGCRAPRAAARPADSKWSAATALPQFRWAMARSSPRWWARTPCTPILWTTSARVVNATTTAGKNAGCAKRAT